MNEPPPADGDKVGEGLQRPHAQCAPGLFGAPRKSPQVVTHKITPGSLAPATVPCWPHLVLLALGAIDSSIQLGVTCVPHRAPEGVADTLQGKGDVDSSAASGGALTHSV